MRACLRPRVGFTLLELTVVTAVLGLLLAMVFSRFAAARDRVAVRAALGDLGGAFALARQTALARRAPVAVVLDTVGGSVLVRSAGAVVHRSELGAYGVSIGAARDSAVYDPRGMGFGLSNLTVTVRRGGIVDTLTMSRLGRVRW